jgi:DNA-binding CsgD family transcriptional regulator
VRIGALSPRALELLRVVAASTRPTEELVAAATGGGGADAGLSEAEAAGVIVREAGVLRFTHPLLGSTVYEATPPNTRRALHIRLSDLVADPEERARHLAHAVTGPDRDVATALESASAHARARAAADAAAELAELARQLTPPGDSVPMRRRSLAAAEYSFDAGDAPRAIGLLQATIDASPPGPERAEMLFRLSSMSWMNLERGVRDPLVRALSEAEGDDALLSGLHQGIAWVDLYQGDLLAATDHARRSVHHAHHGVAAATRADALATSAVIGFLSGRDVDDALAEAIALQDVGMETGSWTEGSVYTTPRSVQGLRSMWAGDLDVARALLRRELAEYERVAMYTVRQEVLCYLAELECRAGRWLLAADLAAEAMETVVESGQTATQSHVVLFNQAYAAAHLGRVEEARAMGTEGLRLALANDDAFNAHWNRAVLGFLALSSSDAAEAHAHLAPVVAYLDRLSPAEPAVIPCIPDDVEALVLLGRPDEAEDVLARLTGRTRAGERPWARAVAERCRGLIAAARGDPDAAIVALERAASEHDGDAQPFELARTLLVKGEVERRAKRRRDARESLDRARRAFEGLGAVLWRDRAQAALTRLGGRTPPGVLTPTERRIAVLAAEGRTNREIADAMFVTVKTVEANLSRAYHKLGIASRRELRGASALRAATGDGADPTDRHA